MSKTIQIMIDKRGVVTNGDVIKAIFGATVYVEDKDGVVTDMDTFSPFSLAWWNSPYKECDIDDSN